MEWPVALFLDRRRVALGEDLVSWAGDGCDAEEDPRGLWSSVLVVHEQAQSDHALMVLHDELVLLPGLVLDGFVVEPQQLGPLGHVQALQLRDQVLLVGAEHGALPDGIDEVPETKLRGQATEQLSK